MSVFEEFLKKHCPDGVEYKTLSELGSFYAGLNGKKKDDFKDGNAKYITYMNVFSNLSVNTNINDTVQIGEKEKQNIVKYGDIIFTGSSETIEECGMSSVVTNELNEKLYLNSFCFGFRFNEPEIMLPDFSKYLFRSTELRKKIIKTASGVTRFNVSKKKMEKILIPLPPIEVQKEIVRILDTFTKYQDLLNRELELRKKQYEYYKGKLLTFGDEVEKIQLKDLFYTKNGYTPSKSNPEFWDSKDVSWFRMEDIRENGRILNEAIQKVSFSAIKGNVFPKNSIIVSTSATIGEHALITCESLANQRFTYLILKDEYKNKFNIFFLFYYCYKLKEYCLNCLNQGNFASVDMTKFNKFEFPIISLKEQERIVKILDQFDTLCNDITRGLPAEIELRKKQYEYYRDKLLTFKEKKK